LFLVAEMDGRIVGAVVGVSMGGAAWFTTWV
jgi:hypothetical protein